MRYVKLSEYSTLRSFECDEARYKIHMQVFNAFYTRDKSLLNYTNIGDWYSEGYLSKNNVYKLYKEGYITAGEMNAILEGK